MPNLSYIYIGYKDNDRTGSIDFYKASNNNTPPNLIDIELKDGFRKPLNVLVFTNLAKENIVEHILKRLGDNTGQPALTITLGATNLAKLTDEEKLIATNKNYTLV